MLFDEPTSALDPEKVSEVLDVIREIVADKLATIILVTHEMEFAKEISDKVYFMEKGLVVESGSPDKIFTNAREDRTRQFLKHFHK
ncbi:amino acid ABC transporter ATP-binding protein [Facklamia sp. HMSC062C11]|uniref:amino acid ABC transporter ATP-binding protein n=1 Tax=Facklamia sp. HMSC062C11 TaxID=1739262 RepID=UPI000ACAEF16|nr:amino acid ABC transporter ATP-binding protein [Facklamia sp. HMSC062C11]